ncbi:MAG: hypothetical protein ACLRZH_19245, partial [Ruthenibacterium lactatiformans]
MFTGWANCFLLAPLSENEAYCPQYVFYFNMPPVRNWQKGKIMAKFTPDQLKEQMQQTVQHFRESPESWLQ